MSVSLLDLAELQALFGYKNRRSALRAISRGTFPVKVYKVGKPWYAKKTDVQKYFKRIADSKDSATFLRRMETYRRRESDKERKQALKENRL